MRFGDATVYVLNGQVLDTVMGRRNIIGGHKLAPEETAIKLWSSTRNGDLCNIEICEITALPAELLKSQN